MSLESKVHAHLSDQSVALDLQAAVARIAPDAAAYAVSAGHLAAANDGEGCADGGILQPARCIVLNLRQLAARAMNMQLVHHAGHPPQLCGGHLERGSPQHRGRHSWALHGCELQQSQ